MCSRSTATTLVPSMIGTSIGTSISGFMRVCVTFLRSGSTGASSYGSQPRCCIMPCLYEQYELENRDAALETFKEFGDDKKLYRGGWK